MDDLLWQDLNASPAALGKLQTLCALVEKWTRTINLVARSTLPELWVRHVEDSARLMLAVPQGPAVWADLGSGGGFPGLVVAVLLADRGDATKVVLVESDQRKAAFLREAARQLGLAVDVRAERAEHLAPLGAGVVSARALAPLGVLCGLAHRHLAPGGVALFPKGEAHVAECSAAREFWRFDLETQDDPGHKGAALLVVRNLSRAGD